MTSSPAQSCQGACESPAKQPRRVEVWPTSYHLTLSVHKLGCACEVLRMISDIFCQLQRFQAVPYRFEIVRRIRQYIEEANRLAEDQLLSCSMLCEPPETIH